MAFHLTHHTFVILVELAGDGYLSPTHAFYTHLYISLMYVCVRVDDLFASAGTRFPTVGPD